jgi:hypothetical protein
VSTIEFPAYIEWPDPGPRNGDAPNQSVAPGGSVTLTAQYYWYGVAVPYHFQWRKDGVIIPGATNYYITSSTMYYHPYLIITNASAADAGNYDLIANGDLYAFTDVNTSLSIRFTHAAVTPPALIGPRLMSDGTFQFAFNNNDPGASFTVLTTTNPSLPLSNWTVVGPATNTAPGLFQFSTGTTNNPQGFYRVRSP